MVCARLGFWFGIKHPVLRSVVLFGVLALLAYAFVFTPVISDRVHGAYLRLLPLTARVSGAALTQLGQEVTTTGPSIVSADFSVQIVRGCDGFELIGLFAAAVLATSAPAWPKLAGLVIGGACLMVLNLVRIVSLFLIGVYFPGAFDVMHLNVWEAAYVFVVIGVWFFWARWATRTGALVLRASDNKS